MRETIASITQLSFLLSDHLGSTSVTADASGARTAELRYKPWGETRSAYGTTPTSFTFTGQRVESKLGLHFYNARWYDSQLGRFIQADPVVPLQSQGTQAWDRYAYVNNNPVRFNDPSGHDVGAPGKNADGTPYHLPYYDPDALYNSIATDCTKVLEINTPQEPDDSINDSMLDTYRHVDDFNYGFATAGAQAASEVARLGVPLAEINNYKNQDYNLCADLHYGIHDSGNPLLGSQVGINGLTIHNRSSHLLAVVNISINTDKHFIEELVKPKTTGNFRLDIDTGGTVNFNVVIKLIDIDDREGFMNGIKLLSPDVY